MKRAALKVYDSGARSLLGNEAFTRHCWSDTLAGGANSLRFYAFDSPGVSVGRYQVIDDEVRRSYCDKKDIAIRHRITGGGALYCDNAQLGWELICRGDYHGFNLGTLVGRGAAAMAAAFAKLGLKQVDACRNDIEVNGKKLGGVTGALENGVLMLRGVVLLDFDIEAMLLALMVPTEKLTAKGLETAADRVTCLRHSSSWSQEMTAAVDSLSVAELRRILTLELGLEFGLSPEPLRYFDSSDVVIEPEAKTDSATYVGFLSRDSATKNGDVAGAVLRSLYRAPGGWLKVVLRVDLEHALVNSFEVSGDLTVTPPWALERLQQQLRDVPFPQVRSMVEAFFAEHRVCTSGVSVEDYWQAIKLALEKVEYSRLGLTAEQANRVFPVNIPAESSVQEVLANASVLLLPYCAKLPECEFRFTQGCEECGLCTIGDAYGLARERGLPAVTVVRYEFLTDTLRQMREQGVKSYIGCCCKQFYLKRHSGFVDAELPGVLLDIEGETCYELGEEGKAYAGTFAALADVDVPTLGSVLGRVKPSNQLFTLDASAAESVSEDAKATQLGLAE